MKNCRDEPCHGDSLGELLTPQLSQQGQAGPCKCQGAFSLMWSLQLGQRSPAIRQHPTDCFSSIFCYEFNKN